MASSRRKGASKAAATRRQWKIGDLVLAKVKGFPAWPATVSEPEKWGYSTDWKKVLVYFFGTQQIAFCNPADVEEFNEVKKESLLRKRCGKGANFVRALNEIIDCYEKLKQQNLDFSANCNEETIESNGNNSAESLSESRTKDEAWVFTVESPLKMPLSPEATSNLNFLTEAAVAAAAEDALHGERMRLEEAGDNLVATGMPMSTSYYTRSKAEVTLPRKGVGQRTLARRSRSSSRLDPNRLQNCMLLSSNNNRSSRYDSNNALPVRSLRRSRRTVKSFDESDQYYTDSSVFVSNNSIEEEDSGTVTVDSDTLSFNQGSTVDSGCKPIQPESVAENHETKTELSDRLDFQMNTGIVKRKRMPNRKRFSNDTAESEAKLDKVVFEADMLKAEHVLHSDDEKCAERYTKEDGDEHLPLVKRARVRMGRPSPAEEEKGNSMHTEDKILDAYRGLRIRPSGSLNYKECNSAEQKSVFVEGDTFDPPLSNSSPVKKPQIWEARKNFVDGEATLPPSKRLHRALEAMSANVVEKSQKSLEYPSMVITSIDVCCSFGNCSEKVENLCNNDFGDESNPEISENNAKSFAAVADCIKPSCTVDISNSDSCNLSKPAESAERKESSLNEHSAEFNVSETNLKLESPNLDGKQTSVDCNNCSLDLFTRPTDGCKIECSELAKTFTGHYPDIHVMCSDAALMEETTVGLLQNDTDMHIDSVDGKGDEASKSRHFSLAETNQDSRLSKIDKEAGPLLKDSNAIASATPSEVIIGTHHQHLSHSNSISDDCLEEKTVLVSHSSSPLTDGLDNRSLAKSNSLSIPDVQLHLDKAKRDDKLSTKGEADVALSSFEAILGSLTRTKETIVRATRIAIECAMFGFANKVVEILAHNLENEPRLHRKVDLFFLVDSITQCSRGMKGDGGIYPSAIQVLLPRLLLAAAPPSCSSHENHRQCLKVLRVWQERKILPEPIIRHHIRELDALCGSYSSWASSHRPLRNERAFDDPIREMEGMLVDEYGSNSSIQLTGFCMPPMLRVEDGGSDSDGENFEAVTPEHNTENIDGDKTLFPVVVKHSHVLKDVDGELEMEDVAQSCEAEVSSISNITGVDSAQTSHHQADNHFWAPFAPPREGVQQTSLPRSAPPQPPRSRPPSRSFPPDFIFNVTKSKTYPSSQNDKYNSQESITNHSVMSGGNPSSDIQSRASRQLPDYTNSSSFRVRPVYHPPVRVSNSIQPPEGALNKSFHLHPPHPSPSNQFVYARDQRIQSRRDVAPPSYPNRFHTRNEENGNVYMSDRLKFPRRDSTGECWRPPLHSVSGPCYPDGSRMPHAPISYTGPRKAAFHNNRRDYPRPMNHRQFIPYRPLSEDPIPVENRGSNYWRPR